MEVSKIQAILAISVVGTFAIVVLSLMLAPLLGVQAPPGTDYADLVKIFSSAYSGIVGIVLGYYFGKTRAN